MAHSKDREHRAFRRSGRITPTSGRMYDLKRWRRLRKRQLFLEPLCRVCGEIATDVDHIVPVLDGGDPWSLDNLQSLCHAHHSAKTAGELMRRGEGRN